MDNNELIGALQAMFDKKVEEVKQHTGAIAENLKGDIKAIAEGHSMLDTKIDGLDTKIDGLQGEINDLKKDMAIVKEYIIGVDIKLNEHETILKRVK